MSPDASKAPTLDAVGQYDLIGKIAEGGMGAIHKGRHRHTGEIVAIKIMPPHLAANPVLLRRFEQEHRAASRLDHPNIVRALEHGEQDGRPYLVLEFVDGTSLGNKLETEGRMPIMEAIRLISQVAQGLHRAHKEGIIHRDVKPDNILVSKEGTAKLADLGLVKEVEADLNLTKTGRGLGTPHFMAPEQFRNAKNADIRCDIYSLGATLYMMVTGELPFRSNGPLDAWMKKINNDLIPPTKLVPDLPERVEWAILRAMSADADRRPASCREFIEDLTGHSTRRPAPRTDEPKPDLWYLVYRDEDGVTHTVKGPTTAIRRSIKEGRLGDARGVRAARTKAGPFEPLEAYPEFRDIFITAAPVGTDHGSWCGSSSVRTPTRAPQSSSERPETLRMSPSARPTPPEVPNPAPHIPLGRGKEEPGSSSSGDWIKWVGLLLLAALISALAAFFLLPLLV